MTDDEMTDDEIIFVVTADDEVINAEMAEDGPTKVERLLDLLLHHFPGAPRNELEIIANDLDFVIDFAQAQQETERGETSTSNDLKAIRQAAENLKKAAEHIQEVGLTGADILQEIVLELENVPHIEDTALLLPKQEAVKTVSGRIKAIAASLEAAAERAEQDSAEPTQSKRGRRQETAALLIAKKCYDIYKEITEKNPTISTDRKFNEKYGPFLELVRDVFTHCNLNASSVVTAAREACRVKMENN